MKIITIIVIPTTCPAGWWTILLYVASVKMDSNSSPAQVMMKNSLCFFAYLLCEGVK